MSSTIYTQDCGCEVYVILNNVGMESVEIDYCSKHAAVDELLRALRFYADKEGWTDFASEEMEPEGFPDWTAEVNLPTNSFFDVDVDGWEIAQAAIDLVTKESEG